MRLFVGLPLERSAATIVADGVRGTLGHDFRPTVAAEMHLTLVFLGETDAEQVPPLADSLRTALAGHPAPSLRLAGTGAFPGPGRARVLWVGVDEPGGDDRLAGLHRITLQACIAAGARPPTETEWRPHVTVARPRDRRGAPLPPAFRDLAFDLSWAPAQAALLESRPGGAGADRYPILAAFEFRRNPV